MCVCRHVCLREWGSTWVESDFPKPGIVLEDHPDEDDFDRGGQHQQALRCVLPCVLGGRGGWSRRENSHPTITFPIIDHHNQDYHPHPRAHLNVLHEDAGLRLYLWCVCVGGRGGGVGGLVVASVSGPGWR